MPKRHDDEDDDWEDVTDNDDEITDDLDEDGTEDEEDLPFGELPLDEEDYAAYQDYMDEFGWDADYFDEIFDVLDNDIDSDWYEA